MGCQDLVAIMAFFKVQCCSILRVFFFFVVVKLALLRFSCLWLGTYFYQLSGNALSRIAVVAGGLECN